MVKGDGLMSFMGNMHRQPTYTTCGQFSSGQMSAVQMPIGVSSAVQMPSGQMPTGFPTGGTTTPLLPAQNGMPAVPVGEMPPVTLQSTLYTPGWLRTQIGKLMRVEFLIGTNGPLVDRTGVLLGVGASYILLQPVNSDDIIMCDIYSIKFVTLIL